LDRDVILEVCNGIVIAKLAPMDDFSSFDCGDKDINEFLKDDALDHIEKDLAVVYVIKDENIVHSSTFERYIELFLPFS